MWTMSVNGYSDRTNPLLDEAYIQGSERTEYVPMWTMSPGSIPGSIRVGEPTILNLNRLATCVASRNRLL